MKVIQIWHPIGTISLIRQLGRARYFWQNCPNRQWVNILNNNQRSVQWNTSNLAYFRCLHHLWGTITTTCLHVLLCTCVLVTDWRVPGDHKSANDMRHFRLTLGSQKVEQISVWTSHPTRLVKNHTHTILYNII